MPFEPTASIFWEIEVMSTGLLRGNISGSASDAVQTIPIKVVEISSMGRVPLLRSSEVEPCILSVAIDLPFTIKILCVLKV